MTNADAVLARQCLSDVPSYPKSVDLCLPADRAAQYDARILALEMKRQKRTAREIEEKTGLSRQLLGHWMRRTAQKDEQGVPLGHRALLGESGKRWAAPVASPDLLLSIKPKPYQLTAFFQKHAFIHKAMLDAATKGRLPGSTKDGPELSTAILATVFFELSSKVAKAPYFPFNGQGRTYLQRWIKRARAKYKAEQLLRRTLDRTANPWAEFDIARLISCYDDVQVDGHSIDIDWIIEAPALSGEGTIRVRVSRLWLIPLIEERSTAVLGYTVAFGTTYSGADVARAVRSSLVPWKPRRLSTTKLAYKPGECLPSAYEELSFVCWNRLKLDRAKAHLADYFLGTLERGVNCVPVFGPVASPDARSLIEGLFELLEEAGFRNVRGRLGSHPHDPKRDDQVEDIFCIDYTLLLDFIDVLICRYNSLCPDGSTTSRVEILRQSVTREHRIYRRLPASLRESYLTYDIFDRSFIRRDKTRLVVRWMNARYHGDALDLCPQYLDEEVVVQASSEDSRKIKVSLQRDGTPIGILDIEPRWSKTPHSLTTRRAAKRMRKGNSFIALAADIPLAVRRELEERQRNGGRFVKSRYVSVVVEQGAVIEPQRGDANDVPSKDAQPTAQVIAGPGKHPDKSANQPTELSPRRQRIAALGSSSANRR